VEHPSLNLEMDLSALLDLNASSVDWSPKDLAGMYRHQLAVPLLPELARAAVLSDEQLARFASPLFPQTFAELLHRSAPAAPLPLLVAARQFAKLNSLNFDSPLPNPVANVLRLAADAAALVYHRRRLSTLSDPCLCAGFQWVMSQDWIDLPTRDLITKALAIPLPLPEYQE